MCEWLIEENRKNTFKTTWPLNQSKRCNASKMAAAGFIYVGTKIEPDAVICFFCNKQLEGWEPDDNPWEEHLDHSPNCEFAKMQKSQSKWHVREYMKLKALYEIIVGRKELEIIIKNKKKKLDLLRKLIKTTD